MERDLLAAAVVLAAFTVPTKAFVLGLETGFAGTRWLFDQRMLVARYTFATFVLMPALAIAFAAWRPDRSLWMGLALLSMTPPAPVLLGRLRATDADVATGSAWQALALIISLVTIPLTLVIVQRLGGPDLRLGIAPVAKRTIVAFALPVVVGFIIDARWPAVREALLRYLSPLSDSLVAVQILTTLAGALPSILRQDLLGVVVILIFAGVAVLAGHLLGGSTVAQRRTLVASLATRWAAPALVLASVNGTAAEALAPIGVYVIAGWLWLEAYARWWRPQMKRARAASPSHQPT